MNAFASDEPHVLNLQIPPQPTDTSCGPTCLHALYGYHGDRILLPQLIEEIPSLETGGTLAVHLGVHALKRGYKAKLYTYNLRVFDPTWFHGLDGVLLTKLKEQTRHKRTGKLGSAVRAYHEFARLGGEIRMEDLSSSLLRSYLARKLPIITGLSSTFLYRTPREDPITCADDDVHGAPAGHFVVLAGYDASHRKVLVADPYEANPFDPGQRYEVGMERLITAILLGVLTYDANLLIIEPKE